jgi:short-chain Z-isoprenyl diphosphate synthase
MLTEGIYRLYERRLERALRGRRLPQHVAVILDGNRRFARARGLGTPAHGHRRGAEKIHELIAWCDDLGVDHVTLWLLSTENLDRDAEELGDLVDIIGGVITEIATHPTHRERGVRVTGVGALDQLPDSLRESIKRAEELTAEGDRLHVQVAVGYGGRQEITDAFRSLLEERLVSGASLEDVIEDLTPDAVAGHLYTSGTPDPDLIIRTSGEVRLSGFMLWQSAHSEFWFCDAYWPEFRRTDFLRALRDFASRQRRFGR